MAFTISLSGDISLIAETDNTNNKKYFMNLKSQLSPDYKGFSTEKSNCDMRIQIPKGMYKELEKAIEQIKGNNGVHTYSSFDIQLSSK